MKPIARIVTRMVSSDDGLMIGSTFAGQEFFKPNTIYVIEEVCGVVTIREVGKACAYEGKREAAQAHTWFKKLFRWTDGLEAVLQARGFRLFMTREEFDESHEAIGEAR